MTTVEAITEVLTRGQPATFPSSTDLAADFLPRSSNRTLEAYRHDRRTDFQRAPDNGW
jgi:hypothetical protein